MSKVVFKLSKPMQLPHSYSTKSLNKTREKTIISPDNANFKKVTGFGIIGTSGLSPVIIYKKTPKENSKLEKFKIKRQIKNTNYISDGGLKQEKEKDNNIVNQKVEEGTVEKEEEAKLKGKKNKNKNKKKNKEKKEEPKEINFVVDDDRDGGWETVTNKKEISQKQRQDRQDEIEKREKIYNNYLEHF